MEIHGTDFTKRNSRDVLVIKIEGTDGEPLELRLMTPSKGLFQALEEIAGAIDDMNDGKDVDAHALISDANAVCARCMSNNTAGIEITEEHLEKIGFTLSDVALFIADYIMFLSRLAELKN